MVQQMDINTTASELKITQGSRMTVASDVDLAQPDDQQHPWMLTV